MDLISLLIYGLIGITICSYIFLIYYFIREEVYKDLQIFDVVILISGPIGLIIVVVLGWIDYGNDEEFEE
jgi:hypothetical protein